MAETWEVDRQVVLAQLQNILLAMRANVKFGSKSRFVDVSQRREHPLMQTILTLQKRLLSCVGPAAHFVVRRPNRVRLSTGSTSSKAEDRTPPVMKTAEHSQSVENLSFSVSDKPLPQRMLTERDILEPFCAICRSPDTSETITRVALASLITMLELPCMFITVKGLRMAIDAAATSRCEIADFGSYEVLLARVLQIYVACVRHPAAAELPEEAYVRAAGRMLVVAQHPDASPLLRHMAESYMNVLVSSLYARVTSRANVRRRHAAVTGSAAHPSGVFSTTPSVGNGAVDGTPANANGVPSATTTAAAAATANVGESATPMLSAIAVATPVPTTAAHSDEPVVVDGTVMMRFISSLISGEVAALDNEGNPITRRSTRGDGHGGGDSRDGGGEGAASSGGGSGGGGGGGAAGGGGSPGRGRGGVAGELMAAQAAGLQLEGLWLAQYALLAMRQHLGDADSAPLRRAVQNDLSRALLIAGVSTTQVVVLSQILRTVHLVVKCASEHLIPQTLSFLRVLHLNPLSSLTEELASVDGNGVGSPLSRPGTRGSPFPSTAGGSPTGAPAASPVSTASNAGLGSGGSGGGAVSSVKILEKQERREVLLESLTEFCSDPEFCTFCYAHYDLAWRHNPLLPQLCTVVVSCAARPVEWGGEDGYNGDSAGSPSRPSGRASSPSRAGSTPFPAMIQSQLIALDATSNMVTEITARLLTDGRQPRTALTNAVADAIRIARGEKNRLLEFSSLFADNPLKKGIPFLLQHAKRVTSAAEVRACHAEGTWLVVQEPCGGEEIGTCLYWLSPLLNKRALGDYIGDLGKEEPRPGDGETVSVDGVLVPAVELWEQARENDHLVVGTVRFFQAQLRGFIQSFDFTGKPLLTSIREMVYLLCLPGESQKIDRVMESFAHHWHTQNLESDKAINPFHSEAGAFVLSFAIIMLNTDLHSGKLNRTMSRDDFKNMNRSIDDGNNVPEDYLSNVYYDVKQHEVIMADMMDRGFANDVTWNLEMGSGRSSSTGAANSLTRSGGSGSSTTDGGGMNSEALLSLITLRGTDTTAPVSSAEDASGEAAGASTGPTAAAVQREVQRVLDPFVFQSIWRYCLLTFNNMMEAAEVALDRAEVRGTTMKEVFDTAALRMSTELTVFTNCLAGVSQIARAANAIGASAVADQCMLTLLSHVPQDLSQAEEVVDRIFYNLPTLLCIREVFDLTANVASSLHDSWPTLARFFLHLYLLGVFSVPSKDGSVPQTPLAANPGITGRLTLAAQTRRAKSEGGWFSSLFGGSASPTVEEEERFRARQLELAMPRVRECVPDIYGVLRLLSTIHGETRVQLIKALSEASALSGTSATSGFATSYEAHFISAVVSQELSSEVLQAYLTTLKPSFQLVLGVVGLPIGPSGGSRSGGGSGSSGAGSALDIPPQATQIPREAYAYWLSVARRLTNATVELLDEVARSTARQANDVAALLDVLTSEEVSTRALNTVVAGPLCTFIHDWMLRSAPLWSASSRTPSPVEQADVHAVTQSAMRLATRLTDQADYTQLNQLCKVLAFTAKHGLLDVRTDSECLIHGALNLGIQLAKAHPPQRSRSPPSPTTQEPSSSASVPGTATEQGGANTAEDTEDNVLESSSPVEVLGQCCRSIITANLAHLQHHHHHQQQSSAKLTTERTAVTAEYARLWALCLQSISALVVSAPTPRDGSEALLCLQRAVLDVRAQCLGSAEVIGLIYNEVLFPLTERFCAPGSTIQPPAPGSPIAVRSATDRSQSQTPVRSPPTSTAPGASETASPDTSPIRPLLMSVLATMAPPPPGFTEHHRVQQHPHGSSPAAGGAAGQTLQRQGSGGATSSSYEVPAEVKCRLINLLPKPLLLYIPSLLPSPGMLSDLWQRVLGTLYAIYSGYPSDGATSAPNSSSRRLSRDNPLPEEAAQVREAVEETVKNMVFVVPAIMMETQSQQLSGNYGVQMFHLQQQQQPVPQPSELPGTFWVATRTLVEPFDFAPPLLEYMTTLIK